MRKPATTCPHCAATNRPVHGDTFAAERRESARIARQPHRTITVGARRSCHFTPTPPIDATCTSTSMTRDDQRQLQLAIDDAVYHQPLDSRPARARKSKPAPLAASVKAGERALDADDTRECKRPVAVAIPYVTEAGETVRALFGGLTPSQAADLKSRHGGTVLPQTEADKIGNGDMRAFGYRVVLWPSEMQRRGAAPIVTVDESATPEEMRADYPIIARRPAPVAALITSRLMAECYPTAGRIAA